MVVSFFINKRLKSNSHTDILEQLIAIKTGKYKDVIENCRRATNAGDRELYEKLKENLPAITFCGQFLNQRKADQISNYNKLLILDVDHLDVARLAYLKSQIINDPFTLACFISPSGQGLKFLVKVLTPVEFHKQAFAALSAYCKNTYQIVIDKSGSDCSRLCYVSYDPETYVNLNALPFEFDSSISIKIKMPATKILEKKMVNDHRNLKETIGYNKVTDRKNIIQIIKFLSKNKFSITETQEKWYKCAYAIANTFTYDIGKKYFLELSKLDGEKYDETKSYQIIDYCYLNRKKEDGLQFSTIVFFAKEKGFIVKTKMYNV